MSIERALPPTTAPVPLLLAFLDEIGIAWEFAEIEDTTFLPGLRITRGRLLVDPARLAYPGDILHEAAHIAVTPALDRMNLGPGGLEEPGLEIAALAWSYAACVHLKLPPEIVFHPEGYKGAGDQIVNTFRSGGTLGQPLLAWMGLTVWEPSPVPETAFPVMKKWLRD